MSDRHVIGSPGEAPRTAAPPRTRRRLPLRIAGPCTFWLRIIV
jgi:hypothetical protein